MADDESRGLAILEDDDAQPLPEVSLPALAEKKSLQSYAANSIREVLPPRAYEGIGTIVLSKETIASLAEDTPDDEIEIRPDKGLIYISHEYVRRRLNAAFGPMQWTLIPGSALIQKPNTDEYYQRWILLIGGVYCSEALSSRTYHEKNKAMSLDDVAEAIKSDCLRRCCKDLGLGLQAWNRRRAKAWRDMYATPVLVRNWKGNETQWRRKDDDPLEGEIEDRAHSTPSASSHSSTVEQSTRNAPTTGPTPAASSKPSPSPSADSTPRAATPKAAKASAPAPTTTTAPPPVVTPPIQMRAPLVTKLIPATVNMIKGLMAKAGVESLEEFGIEGGTVEDLRTAKVGDVVRALRKRIEEREAGEREVKGDDSDS